MVVVMAPDLVDDRCESDAGLVNCGQIGEERVLAADRLADTVWPDRTIVDAARDPVVIAARLSKMPLHEGQILCLHVGSGMKAEPLHLGCGRRTDAMELAYR